ncbi:MAG TPA: immunoglobulin domain-containing protein [Methylomirabilota bacterium]|nr:immunoglobulin domain-containing protein [Methylomirabilota bacterium]
MLNDRFISLGASLLLLSATMPSQAQVRAAGYIDNSFAAPCLSNGAVNFFTPALAALPDGRILAGGTFNSGQSCVNAIARLRTNGAIDGSFNSPFFVGDFVNALTILPDGKILVGGLMRDASSLFAVARLNLNGSLDNTFVRAVTGGGIIINAIAVQLDEKIIAAGYDRSIPGNIFGGVLRLNKGGGVDAGFKQGSTPNSNGQGISAVALQGGQIILGGSFPSYSDGTISLVRDGIVRVNASGSIDPTFNPLISNTDVRALLIQPDGRILVAGNFTANGLVGRCLTRLNPDGTADLTFASLDGHGTTGLSLALQPDGKILLGHSFGIVRITTNGAIDTTFGPLNAASSLGTEAENVTSLVVLNDKRILVGAFRVDDDAIQRRSIARLWGDIPPPPFITQQPFTQTVDSGTNVTFSVIATGAPPISYQWRKNAVNIKGATNSTLTLTNVRSSDTATYTVVISNPGGSVTSVAARLIVNFNTSPLTIITNGVGAVLPDLTKKPLEIGETYTITARPAAGNLFSNWTSLDLNVPIPTPSSPMLTFVMQSNLTLVVDFVPNPFIPVRGVYNGLFFDGGAPSHTTAGGVTMTLDDKGGVKGTVQMGTRKRKFAGTFSLQHVATVSVPAKANDPALTLLLQLEIPNALIRGTVSFGANPAPGTSILTAYRNPFSSKLNPATNSGAYNIALAPAAPHSPAVPDGDGVVGLSVSTAGRVSAKGTLADGSPLKLLTGQGQMDNGALPSFAQVPVYVPLYGGRGSLFGWITLYSANLENFTDALWWIKPASVGGTFYPAGFTNPVFVIGSRYTRVPPRTPAITLTNGTMFLENGRPFMDSITLGPDNKIMGDHQLTLAISPAKGTVTGSFFDSMANKKRTIKGIALQAQNQLRGFFLGTTESGPLFVGDLPAEPE